MDLHHLCFIVELQHENCSSLLKFNSKSSGRNALYLQNVQEVPNYE